MNLSRKEFLAIVFSCWALLGAMLASEAQAAISFVNYGTAVAVASGDMASVGVPAGIQNNDILVVVVHSRDNVDSTMPVDWTQKVEGNGNATNRLEVWWKRTTGSESAPTVTHTGGNSAIAIMYAFRGAVTSGDPFDAVGSVQNNGGSPISTAAITTTIDQDMILHLFGSQDNNTWGTYSGIPITEARQESNTSGNDNSLGLTYGVQSAAGSTGAAGASEATVGPDAGVSVQMALTPEAQAAITLINYGTAVKVGSGNMASVGVPAGIQNNDILIVLVHSRDNVNSTMPGDWTQKVEGSGNANNRLEVWWKRTTGSESAPTVTHTGGNAAIAIMYAFRGAVTSGDPFDVVGSVQSNGGSPISTAAITTSIDQDMILHLFGSQDDNTWGTYSGIPTNEARQETNTSGADDSLGLTYGEQSTAGSTGVAGGTQMANGPDAGVSVQLALRPPGYLTLANHDSGQVSDKFTNTTPVTDVLYRFKLTRAGTVTVDILRVNFTTTGGIGDGDVTACELWEDVDNDGIVDNPGDTLIQGTVSPSGGVITFTTNFTPSTSGTNYLVRATVSNLVTGDTTVFSVGTADIDEVQGGVTESGSINTAIHVQDTSDAFNYRRFATIDLAKLGSSCSSDLSDFPVLISLSGDANLKTTANGGHVYHSQGYDIVFRGSDGTTPLKHEIETYDGSTGNLVAWVKVPTVYKDQNTTLYMYYGNSSISSPTADPANVWDSNFIAVWHLSEDPSGTAPQMRDSTSNGNHGTSYGSMTSGDQVTGKIDGSLDLDGTDDRISVGSIVGDSTAFTASLWFKTTSTNLQMKIWAEGNSGNDNPLTFLAANEPAAGDAEFCVRDDSGGAGCPSYSGGFNDGNWHYLVGVQRAKNDRELFVDGISRGTSSTAVGTVTLNTGNIGAINRTSVQYFFTGIVDEVQISNTARSTCWIQTSFNSKNSPSTFYSMGAEQTPIPTAVSLSSLTAVEVKEGVLLKWQTGFEVNNLGFHVYREENGEVYRLTSELIAGSAFLAGPGTPLTAGHQYRWWDFPPLDTRPSTLGTLRYWLEDIDLNGERTMHGPAEVEPLAPNSEFTALKYERPKYLSELGKKLEDRYEESWKVQELREKLAQKWQEAEGAGTSSPRGAALRASRMEAFASNEVLLKRSAPPTLRPDAGQHLADPQASAVHRGLASRAAVKLFVKEEGWYRVSRSELLEAGLSPKVDPRSLQLYAEGGKVPIRVEKGKQGRPGSWEAIKFYGTGLDTLSTDTRVYWLVEGSAPGQRVRVSERTGGQAVSPGFPYTVERRDRTVYFAALKNGDQSNIFGPMIYQGLGTVDQIVEVRNLLDLSPSGSAIGDAIIEVGVQGASVTPHEVHVLVNDLEVGALTWDGQTAETGVFSVPQSYLEEGENLVTLLPLGGDMDVSVLDYIRLTYWHSYRADGDELRFQDKGGAKISIDGFSSQAIRVLDVTNERNVIGVPSNVTSDGMGGYRATFTVPGKGERTLLALTNQRIRTPAEIRANRPSSWSQAEGYDFLIIAHRDFIGSVRPLAALRKAEGLSVAIVNIEDVYDEFSFGEKSPQALKDFLSHARDHWSRKTKYVLLVGDASLDPRDYLGYGDQDYVPTKLIDTFYLETASDDWFVDFDDDGLPDLAIGRLPVQTKEEADALVSKIVSYGRSSPVSEALLVADQVDSGDYDFEGSSVALEPLLPVSVGVKKVFRGQYGSDAEAKEALLGGINEGPLLVNYVGHGSMGVWRGDLLTSADAEALTNGTGLPLFINMTCLNGYFQAPYTDSLGETLIKRPQGGAVAVWTSSGLTVPEAQAVMNQEFMRLLFDGKSLRLGEAIRRAKASTTDQDMRRTWILFGDPTMRLRP